jgi:hypothetical protein
LISSNVILNPSNSRPVRLPKTGVGRSELTISEIEQKNVHRRLASSSSFTTNSKRCLGCINMEIMISSEMNQFDKNSHLAPLNDIDEMSSKFSDIEFAHLYDNGSNLNKTHI